jgi:imidazolonepropionase-like amidohydrolase
VTLELTDSSFRASVGAQLGAAGRVVWRGDTITVRDTAGARACQRDLEGRYTANISGDTLRLSIVADPCGGRRAVFSGGPYVRARSGLQVLEDITLIDGTGSPAQPNMTVEVHEGRITAVYAAGSRKAPTGASVTNLRGRWLIPGLIDAHVHLATDPSGTDARDVTARKLRAALRGGVTSVRDMAGDARSLAELSRATRVNDLEGPDIHYSALWAGADFMRDPRVSASTRGASPGAEPWMRTVDRRTDWRLAAAEARGSGARGIKLYADGAPEMVREAVRAAHDAGLKVWAHATLFPARPSDLVAAGVDVLSHAPLLVWEGSDSLPDYRARYGAAFDRVLPESPRVTALLRTMKERDVLFEPTMFVFSREGTPRPMAEWATAVTRRAVAMGVPIVAGTDGMIGEGPGAMPNLHRELELLVAAGLTPLQALQAATFNAARAIGIEQVTGTIRPGLSADLVVLSADPLTDIRNTQKIERVLKRGVDVSR